MSHFPQREEKDCLNCGAIVQGKYCQNCGQENVVPKETFWHMVTHFFYDITHFDGSFFTTMRDLLWRPGFLSKEYMKGRRKAYLHPVRMYVFTSAVFFLIFFSMFSVKETDVSVLTEVPGKKEVVNEMKNEALKKITSKEDSLLILKVAEFAGLEDSLDNKNMDSSGKVIRKLQAKGFSLNFGDAGRYVSVKQYDSIQNTLPAAKRDGKFLQLLYRKFIGINERYKGRENKLMADISNKFIHSVPYLLFVSLPLFAFFLKLLYIRHKQFYYADHGVFLIHLYIFTFLFLLLFFGLDKLGENTKWGFTGILKTILMVTGLVYTLKAMKHFYQQRWGKTITKFVFFNFLCLISIAFLFGIFLLFSVYLV
ncbi:MAG TPA: DUF3667 domain-containing protein [Chitinophagaceae bacterium]|nr:DUF3667 domain-containing protein [Chitinophagaceae bacterium]